MRYYFNSTRALLALLSCFPISSVAQSPLLFTGATIITFNTNTSRTEVIHNSALLIEGDTISQIYNNTTPTSYPDNTEVVNSTGKIISPGFIDTHHHLWQTAFKTLGSNTTLDEYFQRYGSQSPTVLENLTPEDKYLGVMTGCMELLNAGTTTVLDHAHGDSDPESAEAMINATFDSGIRAYHGFTVQDFGDLNAANWSVEAQMQKLESLASDPRFRHHSSENDNTTTADSPSRVDLALAYDGFTSASDELLTTLWDLTTRTNLSLLTTHYVAGPYQSDNSPTRLSRLGWLNTTLPVIFSHGSFLTALDISHLRTTNQYISTTPESEFHYGHGNPNVELIQDQAALGVDTHFTFSSEMLGQARLWLQRLRLLRYTADALDKLRAPVANPMSVEQAFYLVTRAGALALRRPDLGILAPGARADVVVFEGETPNMLGWRDAVAALVLHSNVGDVEGVVVGGEWVKRGGRLVGGRFDGVKERFLRSRERVQGVWEEMEWPELGGGMGTAVPERVDTLRGEGTGY